jgi:taurine dioxygenase
MASAVSIEPSGLGFGARVVGVDLSGRVSAEDLAAIRAAWLEYQVLVFPGQEVDEERQIAFGRNFGALSAARLGPKTDTPQYVLYVATKVEEGQRQAVQPDGELLFHMDQSYLAAPNRATMLFAITVPEVGGDTLFASAQLAYQRLDPELRARVDHLSARHVPSRSGGAAGEGFVHPLVIKHPESKKPVLFTSRLITSSVEGLSDEESKELLEQLWSVLEDERYVYRHSWKPGDLVFWDNRALLHSRTDFTGERVLRRITMEGEPLLAAVA